MDAIVLAGGFGTRLRSAVPDVPKPLAPINGRPFLEYLLDYWIGQSIARFVLSVGYLHEMIEQRFGTVYRGCPIEYAVEKQPLGTGGGLLQAAAKVISADVLALNGDTFFEVPLTAMRGRHRHCAAACTMAMFETADAARYMRMTLDDSGKIASFGEPAATSTGYANGGVYLMRTDMLRETPWQAGVPVSLEQRLLPDWLRAGSVICGFPCAGRFIDIGIPADYLRAQEWLR
jgi:D-glycero-alpha-D-manno-heptose 1-phosphate guanylyltransferase